MKTLTLAILLFSFHFSSASAMPCDTGYLCTSKSNHYVIEIQRCRYDNSIHLVSVTRKGTKLEGASLGAAYDGTYDHGLLAFEVSLPLTPAEKKEGSQRVLSVEVRGKPLTGQLKEMFWEDQPRLPKDVRKESVECVESH
jgi:hypothetical protein